MGRFLNAFVSPPADTFAGSLNGIAGLITDDSSQMYVFSEGLIEAGFDNFTNNDWLACLLRWADMQPYANYKRPHNRTNRQGTKEGRPTNTIGRIGTSSRQAPNVGTTNGAGMRVAPAGLIWRARKKSVSPALITCLPSHDTNIAIASACAIAAATSQAMLPEASLTSLLDAAIWERITANARPNNMHDVSQGHLSPCASNLQRTSPDEPMTGVLSARNGRFGW